MAEPRSVIVSVHKHEGAFTIEEKRVCLPFTVTATCPICGSKVSKDLSASGHLGFPTIGASQRIDFYHTTEDDVDHEFYVAVQIDMTISVLPLP